MRFDALPRLVGREVELAETCRELKFDLHRLSAPVVGALQITCADETEHECAAVFERAFAREVLPRLKYGSHVPFRLANPGARYEWGCVAIAEDHFATPDSEGAFKVLVIKVNSHVAADRSSHGVAFGRLARYGTDSAACGALDALRAGKRLPFLDDLEQAFLSEGLDRLALLEEAVQPGLRPLAAALCSARLQARRIALDIQGHEPRTPTFYVVLHGVTLNMPGPDRELFGGLYTLDRRERPADRYCGIGDDPSRYEIAVEAGWIRVRDGDCDRPRDARDHRRLALERARAHPGWERLEHDLRGARRAGRPHPAGPLGSALDLLGGIAPLPAALLLVGTGVAGLHLAERLHQAVAAREQEAIARRVVREARRSLDATPPERATRLLAALLDQFG